MTPRVTRSLFVVAAIVSAVPSVVSAQATIEVSQEFDRTCYLTTFEGAQYGEYAGTISDTAMSFTFSDPWVTATNVPGRPIGENTVAALVGTTKATVTLSSPVVGVSLLYTSPVAVTLEGLDSAGNVVASASGGSTPISTYVPLSMVASGEQIIEVTITGGQNVTGIDDFQVCTLVTDPIEMLENLIAIVADINYVQGINNALDGKLDAIFAAVTDANENNDTGACNALDALVIYVEAQWSAGRLNDDQALYLIDAAGTITDLLCPE